MDMERVDLNLICRTCKCVSGQMRSVFEGFENPNQNPRIDEMLMACAAVQVNVGDGLPTLMCSMCLHQLKGAFDFKKQCETVDASLRQYAKGVNTIKQELQHSDFMESLNTLSNLLNNQVANIKDSGVASNNMGLSMEPTSSTSPNPMHMSNMDQKTTAPLPPETDYIQFLDSNQMLLTCRECAKIFTTLEGLRCHKRLHAGTTFKCKQCDKSYTRLNHLQRHEASHGKHKVHVCKICNKTLTRMEHLKRHLVTHLREKPFSCKTCNRGFNRIEHLHNHIPRCKGENVHICNVCNKAFNREDSLEVHKQQHDINQLTLPTIENLDNIEEHYIEVDYDATEPISDEHSDLEDCFEPQVEVTESLDDARLKEFAEISSQELDDSSSQDSVGGCSLTKEIKEGLEEEERKPEEEEDEEYDNQEDKADITVKPEHIPHEEEKKMEEDEVDFMPDLGMDVDGNVSDSNDSSDSDYVPKKASPPMKRGRGRPRKHPPKIKTGKRGRPSLGRKMKREYVEEEEGEYPCPECKEMFTKVSKLDKHTRTAHAGIKVHKCDVCGKDFSRANHLKRHLTSHSEAKPYQCDICTKSFNRRDHLQTHQKLHDRTNDHPCDVCQKPFSRADHLAKHKASKHGIGEKVMGEKRFICEVCNKGFTTEKYRDVHMKGHSEDSKKYKCKVCEKSFLSKSHLTEHMKFHNEHSKKFLCSECGQRFIRNDYLVIHMRRHRGEKPFKCKFCGKGFPRTTDLTVHERYHTGEKTHLCTICGRGFGRAYNLTVHMRTHTGEKPYQCTYCDAAFAQGNDLKAHVRRHTGERFQCELCTESFLMGYLLTQHKRTVHGLNVVSNIRRLQPIHKQENPDDPPPITIPLPKPVVPESLMFNHLQAQLAVAQMQLARDQM